MMPSGRAVGGGGSVVGTGAGVDCQQVLAESLNLQNGAGAIRLHGRQDVGKVAAGNDDANPVPGGHLVRVGANVTRH